MISCIVPVLCPWKEVSPFLGPLMDKAPKILFKAAIHNFGLSICLRMVGGAKFEFGARHGDEFLPELANEYWITDYGLGHAMQLNYVINEFPPF